MPKHATNIRNPFAPTTTQRLRALDDDALVTVAIPTANHSPYLDEAITRWFGQTIATHIMLTSTDPTISRYHTHNAKHDQSGNVITNHIGHRNWLGLSEPVALALDVAQLTCRTAWLLHTHDDVLPNHSETIERLLVLAFTHAVPIVAYQMSDRSHLTDEWHGMPSHTLTLIHLPTIRHQQLWWHDGWTENPSHPEPNVPGWPDTETFFGRRLKNVELQWHCLAEETNERNHQDEWIWHRRSDTTHRIHFPHLISPPTNAQNPHTNAGHQ